MGRAVDKLLLLAGAAAVIVYAIGDVLSGVLYDGYSWADQAISELRAFGSPVRPLMVAVILVHNVLLLAFGVGILRVATPRSGASRRTTRRGRAPSSGSTPTSTSPGSWSLRPVLPRV